MTDSDQDIIDYLAGTGEGPKGPALRARRPVTKENAQASWLALFAPSSEPIGFPLAERFAVALFVSLLHGQPGIAEFYADRLRALDKGETLLPAVTAAAKAGSARGPYGHFPVGPLTAENTDGLVLKLDDAARTALGNRLSAGLEHAHLLIFHLRDANPQALGKLLEAGWTATDIVTLSQLVSFLAFQIRVVAGLKVLTAA